MKGCCPLVREGGLEPPRPCDHWHLKRLPIPPLARTRENSSIAASIHETEHRRNARNVSIFTFTSLRPLPDPTHRRSSGPRLDSRRLMEYSAPSPKLGDCLESGHSCAPRIRRT